jgi:glycosyltransferase involved in cell wall biosynthesis
MNKLKVLLINNYHYRRGGADTIYFNTIELLRSNGHQVQSYSLSHPDNLPDKNSGFFAKYHNMPEKSFFSRVFNLNKYFYSNEAKKGLKLLLKQFSPDVVHAHLLYGGLSSSVLSVLKYRDIPVVYSAHDYRLVCPNQSFLINGVKICEDCKGRKYFNAFKNKCNRGNRFFSLVIGLESYFRDIFFPIEKYISKIIVLCQFGLEKHKEFRPDLSHKLTQLFNYAPNIDNIVPLQKKGEYFLFFGRLSSEKGLLTLIEAWRNVPIDCKLKIVGTGPLESRLLQIANDYKLNNVELMGYRQGDDLVHLIRNASFILVPSEWYENNPMTVIEAFSHGKPAIGSNIGGIPELIENEKTGFLFQAGNIKELTDCIIKANNLSDNKYSFFANAARKFIEMNCAPEVHYNSLIQIYNEVVYDKSN